MFNFLKRAASTVPNPDSTRVAFFADENGLPKVKKADGTVVDFTGAAGADGATGAAGADGATGAAGATSSGTAFVDILGNDGTAEIGNAAKPYLTAQAAWAALNGLAVANPSLDYILRLGVGQFYVTLTDDWHSNISPVGTPQSFLSINGAGANGASAPDWSTGVDPANGQPGGNGRIINLKSDGLVQVDIDISGGNGGDGGFGGGSGAIGDVGGDGGLAGTGGAVTFDSVRINFMNGNGGTGGVAGRGNAAPGNDATGGTGSTGDFKNVQINQLNATGGSGGVGGNGGSITVSNSQINTLNLYSGYGPSGYGYGGYSTIENSRVNHMDTGTVNGGAVKIQGSSYGYIFAITLIDVAIDGQPVGSGSGAPSSNRVISS